MRDAGGAGFAPVFVEARIDPVLAFRRLDEGEGDTGILYRGPIDIALPFGDIDAVDLVLLRMLRTEILRIGILEARLRLDRRRFEIVITGGAAAGQQDGQGKTQNKSRRMGVPS